MLWQVPGAEGNPMVLRGMRDEVRSAMDSVLLDEAVELTRRLWRAYLLAPSEEGGQFILRSLCKENFSLIGTGKHEVYLDLDTFLVGFERDQEEAQGITFEVLDEYCEARPLGEDACLVLGTLWVRERADEPKPLLAEMDTRFSLIFRYEDGRWLLVHLHHSTPNVDQRREEYYPKTVTEQANAALAYSKSLERRAELDSMTELLNRIAFENHVSDMLASGDGGSVFFMIDLDDFKQVNDTLGHPEGDRIIVEFADVLRDEFARDALVGRMGGDEFAAFAEGPLTTDQAERKARELIERWSACSSRRAVGLGCSIGLVLVDRDQSFFELYRMADEALYASKRNGKGRFSW